MNGVTCALVFFFNIFAVAFGAGGIYGHRKNGNPLLGEEARKNLRATECHFGKTIKELGSTWSADLGPPFGVMYCIRCECVPFQKKRRIVAKVQCRNIKHDCPKPTCDEPVLLPGRCCKTCPGDQRQKPISLSFCPDTVRTVEKRQTFCHCPGHGQKCNLAIAKTQVEANFPACSGFLFVGGRNVSIRPERKPLGGFHVIKATGFVWLGSASNWSKVSEVAQDIPPAEEDKNMKYFGALLTGRTSLVFKRDDIVNIPSTSKNPAYQIIATGRFTFHKKNLYYSFYLTNSLNQNPPRPRTIQFINYKGDLLEEQNLSATGSVYQNATSKVCGVWRRIPREYKRLLRDETLYVALLWGNDLALSGQIARLKALNTEQFSALLTPPYSELEEPDSGGTAIISTLASPPTVHISLVFNGVFLPDDILDVPLTVRLENSEKGQVIFEEIIRVHKPSHTLNFEEVKSLISMNELRMITRGKFSVSISSRHKPEAYSLSGPVITRTSCEIFQTPLAPSSELEGSDAQETTLMLTSPSAASGMAWMYVNRDGSITYNIQMSEMHDMPVFTLMPLGKGRKVLDVQQFAPSHITNGLATGTLDKLSPKLFELLYAGELSLSVASSKTANVIRGQFTSRPVAGAVDSKSPALLKRVDNKHSDLTGMAWLSIDFDCDLYYEVQLSGNGAESRSYQLFLEDTPMIAPNSPVSKRHLEDFNGTFLEGFAQLTPQELLRMDTGICFFEITDFASGAVLLRADMKQIKIPIECLSHTNDNDVPSFVSMSSHRTIEITKCFHEGIFYDEGSQWRHPRDPCKMCHCLRGKEKCDDVVCPSLPCANKIKPSPRECCPTCYDSSNDLKTSVGCTQAGQFYPNGSFWHPYLPPYGFNLCVVMSCVSESQTSVIKYSRVQCPPLKCSEKEAIRMEKNSCCKVCPTPEVGFARDQSVVVETPRKKTDEEILQEGGCTYLGRGPYENNTEWSHRVDSIGVTPCVKCRCKDGVIMCERKRCLRANCTNNSTTQSNSDIDDCCSHQCRYRRQSKHSQRQKLWRQKKRGSG